MIKLLITICKHFLIYSQQMMFDEIHMAKSAYIIGKKSEQGRRVMRLQYNFPMARVVYCTATAASEVEHLLVLSRLNIWGRNTAYVDQKAFRKILSAR